MAKTARPPAWIRKALRLIGEGHGAITTLAQYAGVPRRTASHWLSRGMRPRREDDIIRRVAARLGVPDWWLRDPALDGQPPPIDADLTEAVLALPPKMRPLVLAALEPDTLDWLLRQLALYSAAQRKGRERT